MARVKIIETEKIFKIVEQIEETDSRAAAIMMGAFLENWLGLAILKRCRPLGKERRERLFGDPGPLATFHQKIEMAHALALIGPITRNDLAQIKAVRNHFAHEVEPTDFSNKDVVKACNDLAYPAKAAMGSRTRETKDPKSRFFDTAHHLAVGFSHLCEIDLPPPSGTGVLDE